jgi:hypothetical protein
MNIRNAVLAALFAASCAPLSAGPPDPTETADTAGSETSETAPEPARTAQNQSPPPVQRSSDEWCARAFCGCWEDFTLSYSARIVGADGAPAEGIVAVCRGDEEPVATSSSDGVLAFEVATQRSPGCGYQRCRFMTLTDPQGRFADKEVNVGSTMNQQVVLEGR